MVACLVHVFDHVDVQLLPPAAAFPFSFSDLSFSLSLLVFTLKASCFSLSLPTVSLYFSLLHSCFQIPATVPRFFLLLYFLPRYLDVTEVHSLTKSLIGKNGMRFEKKKNYTKKRTSCCQLKKKILEKSNSNFFNVAYKRLKMFLNKIHFLE